MGARESGNGLQIMLNGHDGGSPATRADPADGHFRRPHTQGVHAEEKQNVLLNDKEPWVGMAVYLRAVVFFSSGAVLIVAGLTG